MSFKIIKRIIRHNFNGKRLYEFLLNSFRFQNVFTFFPVQNDYPYVIIHFNFHSISSEMSMKQKNMLLMAEFFFSIYVSFYLYNEKRFSQHSMFFFSPLFAVYVSNTFRVYCCKIVKGMRTKPRCHGRFSSLSVFCYPSRKERQEEKKLNRGSIQTVLWWNK